MSDEDVKKCPYCAETIKKEAKICRFCHIDLTTGQLIQKNDSTGTQTHEVQTKSSVADGVKLGYGMFIVLPILIVLGLLLLAMIPHLSIDVSGFWTPYLLTNSG